MQTWSYGSAAEWLRNHDRMTWGRSFSGRPDQVAAARDFARYLFAGCGREDDVAYIVSELATNTIRYTRSAVERVQGGWFGLQLVYADLAYIGVTDLGGGDVPRIVPIPEGGELAVSGRGLRTVANLACAVGIHGSPQGGHTVWADLDLRANAVLTPELAVLAS